MLSFFFVVKKTDTALRVVRVSERSEYPSKKSSMVVVASHTHTHTHTCLWWTFRNGYKKDTSRFFLRSLGR